MKVLVIGQGGREHCLVWKLSQSPLVEKIYCLPGNGGTALIAKNLDIPPSNLGKVLETVLKEKIDLTVVGPEQPLVDGIVDEFEKEGLKIFGPRKDLALLEGSKVFAKEIMRKYGIPTADFRVFDNTEKAKDYIRNKELPFVIKADGLCAGKGVVVCFSEDEAIKSIDEIMAGEKFGKAGKKIIIEEYIEGREVSVLIFTDGDNILPLVPSEDHKRVDDNDKGPNTGGMGAYAPVPWIDKDLFDKIISKIFYPLIKGLKSEGKIYKGVLYGGLMIKDNEPYVLEFNVRFGDPETQAIIPKLKSDLLEIMFKVVDGKLKGEKLNWDERVSLCVVLASRGYPDYYEKGEEISGLEKLADLEDVFVFHAGTKSVTKSQGHKVTSFVTDGGRVLNITGLGSTLKDTQAKVYRTIENISFKNMHYRKDIGNKALYSRGA